ncbi:hypothetical protein [Arundinibacter roseus]|uniref:Uncharacterized protein n=1 Tax=Arundinibacter roseus TaxID=2070510 RepID=A0A4V2X8E9_9BACT|nr:hypothetical protein [Arundinibacter roseus]TDB59565.1 hypothetical protein EZE20_22465 [Arundinibacter roseus]
MKYQTTISQITSVDEIEGAWTKEDYVELLKRYGFSEEDYKNVDPKEFLYMAIADQEPTEAAAILLEYKLSEHLNEGQISQISHNMQLDKISEEYPEIPLHHPLFNINQLLYKAFNGKFPHAKASLIAFETKSENGEEPELTKELALKALSGGLSDRSLLNRLFADQLVGKVPFPEADAIVWELKSQGNSGYQLITSEYWLSEDDLTSQTFESDVVESKESEDEEA